MTDHGYCIVDDVRRVMQQTDAAFDSKALGEDSNQLVVDAITGLTEWIDKHTHKHWYVPGGVTGDDQNVIATDAQSRDDQHDLMTRAALVDGTAEEPVRYSENSDAILESGPEFWQWRTDRTEPKERLRISFGDLDNADIPAYTRIRLNRKDVSVVNDLMVVNEDGGFDDWTGAGYDGGVGNTSRGDDWWIRVNNRGISELYLDAHQLPDDLPAGYANVVYVDFDYGEGALPMGIRRGVAHLAASDLIVDSEYLGGLPDAGGLVNVETQAERWERRGKELLSHHFETDIPGLEQE